MSRSLPWVRVPDTRAAAAVLAGLAGAAALTPVAGSVEDAGPLVVCVAAAALTSALLVASGQALPAAQRFRPAVPPLALLAGIAVAVAVARAGTRSVDGLRRLVTSTVPLDAGPPELAALGAAAAVAATLAAVASARGRPLAVVLAAPALLAVAGLALVAADRPGPLSLLPLLVVAALLAVLLGSRGDANRAVGAGLVLALAVGGSGLVATAVAGEVGDPVDLRAGVSVPVVPTQAVSPLASFAAARSEPDVPLVEINGPAPPRLRLVALEQFDGTAWTGAGRYRRVGRQLPPVPARVRPPAVEQVTLDLVLPNPDLLGWVPAPGRLVAVSTPGLGVDPGTGDVVVPQGVRLPRQLRVTGELPVVGADDLLDAAAVPPERPVPPSDVAGAAPELVALVEGARRPVGGGGQSSFAVLAALEAALRDPVRFSIDTGDTPPVGHGLLQVGRVLTDGAGTAEQYASAFAVGARLLGAQSRLVVGYAVPAGSGGVSRVGTRNLDVWPEVLFDELGWVAFDPVPGAGRPVPSPGQVPAGAAPASAEASPSSSGRTDEPQKADGAGGARDGNGAGVVVSAVLAGVLLPLAPWSVKRVRRARRRRAPPAEAVAGAWRELGDRLTERGQRPSPTMTPADLVRVLSGRLGRADARGAVRELAGVAGAARFAREPATTADADRAWTALARIELGLSTEERWPVRVRAALDVRPALRR